MTEKNKEQTRVCKSCVWYVSRMAKCILHDRKAKHEDTCDDHETPHDAAIYDELMFGNFETL